MVEGGEIHGLVHDVGTVVSYVMLFTSSRTLIRPICNMLFAAYKVFVKRNRSYKKKIALLALKAIE